jgi:hypothetical protein
LAFSETSSQLTPPSSGESDANLASARVTGRCHPTVKPVAMIATAILDCSARGDVVLGPFLGQRHDGDCVISP